MEKTVHLLDQLHPLDNGGDRILLETYQKKREDPLLADSDDHFPLCSPAHASLIRLLRIFESEHFIQLYFERTWYRNE